MQCHSLKSPAIARTTDKTSDAIAGDGLSFWLGHRYHHEILGLWPLNRHSKLIQRSEAFFIRRGDKSVFLARFTPGVRAFVPLLAGTLGMAVSRFCRQYRVGARLGTVAYAAWCAHRRNLQHSRCGGKTTRDPAGRSVTVGWMVLHIVRWTLRRGIPYLIVAVQRLRSWAGTHDT
ncbi:DedA family protein [Pseudomonas sp. LB1P83]